MKKKLSFLMAFIAMALYTNSVWAQTDVTSQYLENADFEASAAISSNVKGYGKDGTPYGLQEVTGWSIQILSGDNGNASYPNSGMAGAVFGYGTPYQMQGYNQSAPTQNPSGGTDGQCLGYMSVWGLGGYYYQEVTLPAGLYSFSADIFNQSGTQNNESYIGFIPNSGVSYTVATNPKVGEWTSSRISFAIESPTSGRIAIGYKSVGSGSSSNPHIFVDDVKLSYTPLSEIDLTGYTSLVDFTSKVGTSKDAWHASGGPVDIDGVSMPEVFQEAATDGVGNDVLWQTVEGLDNGEYVVELWANARVAWRNSPATDGQMELTYLFANNVEKSIAVLLNPSYNSNASHVLEGVEVTDGTLKMGMTKKAAGSNWHTIQIKSLAKVVSDYSSYAAVADAKYQLQLAIDKAEAIANPTSDLTGAIATAKDCMQNSKSTVEISAATEALNTAIGWAAATIEAPLTHFIVNGTFDSTTSPWKTTTNAQNQALAANQYGAFTGNFFENWNPAPYTGKIYQVNDNVPNGLYELSICAFVDNFDASAQYVYANNDKQPLTTGAPTAYSLYTTVTDHKIEVGLEQINAVTNWMGIDNVVLKYYGDVTIAEVETYKNQENVDIVNGLLADAQAINPSYSVEAKTQLDAAVAAGEAAVANPVKETLLEAIALLETAIARAEKSVAMNEAALEAPVDFTQFIVNPTFDKDISGWELSAPNALNKGFGGASYTNGSVTISKFIEAWSGSDALGDMSIVQTLEDLPTGVYTLAADLVATNQNGGAVDNIYLMANDTKVPVATGNGLPERFEAKVAVTDGGLTFGLISEGTAANWVALDNVTLKYGEGWTIYPSAYEAGIKNAESEKHVIDDELTIYTEYCYWSDELTIYNSPYKGKFYSNELSSAIKNIRFDATTEGEVEETLVVYGSIDGETWKQVAEVVVPCERGIADFAGTAYNFFRVETKGFTNVSISKMVVELEPTVELPLVVDVPAFSMAGGNLYEPANLQLSSEQGATIYWSTDGKEYVAYIDPIAVEATCTIYAYAEIDGVKSKVVSATYAMATEYESIAALLATQATTDGVPVTVTLGDASIVAVGDGQVTIAADSVSIVIVDAHIPNNYMKGVPLTGKISGVYKMVNGVPTLCEVNYAYVEVLSTGNIYGVKPGNTYYIYNTKAKAFLTGANSWGTRASLGEDGLPFIVEENNGLYALNGVVSNGGDSHYFGNGGFIDAAPAYFTLTEVAEGTYTIGWDGNYYASQEGSNIVATVTEVSDACHWLFLTKDNITTRMLAASIDNPYNATALIACANFGRNNTQSGSWSGAPAIGGDDTNMNAEKWNAGITAVTQRLTGLPNGTYELKAQGFYRLGNIDPAVSARDKGTEVYDVQVVANGSGTKIKSVMDDAGKLAVGSVYGSYGQAPNTMAEASAFFSAGYYENSVLFTVTDGTATIGVQKFTSVDADWLIFDNFRLVYYGAAPIEEVEALKQAEVQVYVDELAALVENAKAITNTYTEGAQAQLDAALVVAEDALQVATYDALVPAITAVKKAIARAERAIEINEWIAAEKPSIINPLDVASLIENPNMDINITGWNTVNSDYAEDVNGVWKHNPGSKTSADGKVVMNGFQEAWLPSYTSLNNASSTQTIIDIPNGIYTVSADVIAQAPIRVNGVHFVANDQKVPVATANEEPKHYSIELEVTDNTLTIGVVGEYTTANWLAFDNVTLTYVGMPTDDVVYTMVQDTTDLVAGGKYVLMAQVNGGWVAMSDQSGEIRVPSDTVEVGTVWKSLLTVADSVTTAPALFAGAPVALTLESDSEGWKFYDALTGKYLHWENGDCLLNDAVGSVWTITFNQYGHNAIIAYAEDAARVLQYDVVNAGFGAYAGTQTPVYLFMEGETKVAPVDPIVPSFTTIAEVLAFEVNNKIELVLDKAGIVSLDGNNMSITDGIDTLAIYDDNIPAEFNADGVLGGKLVATLAENEGNKQLILVDWSGVTFKASTDWTYMVSTENTAWGGAYCATQYAPAITTVDGREAQMVEKFESTAATTGTLLSQTVTGLDNGMYTVVLYANALSTHLRDGFATDVTDGATDVAYVFANDVQAPVTAAIATETAANGEYTLENVMVSDGTLVLGLGKAKAGTNWHTIQIKSLTYAGDLGKNSTFAGGSITSIKEGNYYVFYTDAEGKNHFLHAAGQNNWVVGNNPVTMAFSAGNVTDETPFANYASFMASNGFYMSNAANSDGTGAIKTEAVDAGNGPKKRVWESQVFYKNKAGKYAIRMTNSDSESWGANCFVNIDPATLAVAPGNPSLADALYVWEIADEDDPRFSLGVLQALIEKAEGITDPYNKDVAAALDAVVAKAKTATAAQVQTIKVELEAAIAAAETSVADYKAIALELARCNAIFDNVASGEADLKAAITATETAVADRTADAETLTELQYALAAYEVEGLVNGDFSDGVNGWTGDMATGNHNEWTNVNDGFAEKWTAAPGTLADLDFYQEISGLPAGTYTFMAYVNACQQANDDSYEVTGVSVYANNNAVEVHTFNLDRDATNRAIGAELVMVTASVAEGETLKVGMKVEATDANWIVMDNARLFSFNHNGTGIVNIQNSESVTVYSVDGKSIKTTVDGMKNLEKGLYIVNGKKMYIK